MRDVGEQRTGLTCIGHHACGWQRPPVASGSGMLRRGGVGSGAQAARSNALGNSNVEPHALLCHTALTRNMPRQHLCHLLQQQHQRVPKNRVGGLLDISSVTTESCCLDASRDAAMAQTPDPTMPNPEPGQGPVKWHAPLCRPAEVQQRQTLPPGTCGCTSALHTIMTRSRYAALHPPCGQQQEREGSGAAPACENPAGQGRRSISPSTSTRGQGRQASNTAWCLSIGCVPVYL
jgi:hypothetical protein